MRRPLQLVIAFTALAALGFGVFQLLGDDPVVEATAAAPRAPTPGSTDSSTGALSPGELLDSTDRATDATQSARERQALDPLAESSLPATFVLRVVTGDERQAVAGAEIRFAFQEDIDAWRDAHPAERELPLEACAGLAHARTTGADGRVWLPAPDGERRLTAVCNHEGLYGRRYVREAVLAQEESLELLLEPDHRLVIQVVDAADRPRAGVPVALFRVQQNWASRAWSGTTSGPEGTAEVHHIQSRFGSSWSRNSLAATLGFPCKKARLESVPTDEPVSEVRLRLPATGSVSVSLRDLAGEPHRDPVELTFIEHRTDLGFLSVDRPLSFSATCPEGRYEFPYVELGLVLSLSARTEEPWKPAEWTGNGPRAAGEQVGVELRFEEEWPVLRGRLVDVSGQPLAETEAKLLVDLHTESSWSRLHGDVASDAEGRFDYVLRSATAADSELELTFEVASDAAPGGSSLAVLLVPMPLAPGPNDIGDVVIGASGARTTGRVEGPHGEPIAGADVRVHEWRSYGDAPEQGSWMPLWNLDVTTDAEGNFDFGGEFTTDHVQLSAEHSSYTASERVDVAVGARGVRLVLGAAGSVRITVELADGVPPQLLEALLRLPDAEQGAVATGQFSEDGARTLKRVTPGTYTVEVRLAGETAPLRSVAGVSVRPGEQTEDSRLAFDLRDEVGMVRLDVRDTEGGPVRTGSVRILPPEPGAKPRRGASIVSGAATVLFVGAAVDLELRSEGYRTLRLEQVRDDREVVLRDGLSIVLRIPGDLELPTGNTKLMAALVPVSASLEPHQELEVYGPDGKQDWLANMPAIWTGKSKHFKEDKREVRQVVAYPGVYQVDWTLMTQTETSANSTTISSSSIRSEDPRAVLEVLDLLAEQVFDVAPDAAQYAAELERLAD